MSLGGLSTHLKSSSVRIGVSKACDGGTVLADDYQGDQGRRWSGLICHEMKWTFDSLPVGLLVVRSSSRSLRCVWGEEERSRQAESCVVTQTSRFYACTFNITLNNYIFSKNMLFQLSQMESNHKNCSQSYFLQNSDRSENTRAPPRLLVVTHFVLCTPILRAFESYEDAQISGQSGPRRLSRY